MTWQAVVQDGLIAVNTYGELHDGAEVEVAPLKQSKPHVAKKTKKAKGAEVRRGGSKRKSASMADSLFVGMWKGRKDFKGKSAVEIMGMLRERDAERKALQHCARSEGHSPVLIANRLIAPYPPA